MMSRLQALFQIVRVLTWTSVLLVSLLMPYHLFPDDLLHDSTAPNMQPVNDALNGQRSLLRQDDVSMVLAYKSGSSLNTGMIAFRTSDSHYNPNPQSFTIASSSFPFQGGVPASTGIGRMYNMGNDVVVTVTQGSGSSVAWTANLWEPVSGSQFSIPIGNPSQFQPYGPVYSQIAMGDFNGDGLSDALLFYDSVAPGNHVEWGMSILTADDAKTVGSVKQGSQFYTFAANGVPVPITGSVVTGDFNGDGRDEIALLLTDNQTIQFYDVDPKTFAISPSTSLKLPAALYPNALSAGRFRNSQNDELVAVGQIAGGPHAITIYSVETMQIVNGNSQFSPAVAQGFTETRFQRGTFVSGILAQAAPVISWFQGTSEQLLIGLQFNVTPTGIVWIASFDSDFNFKLAMSTDVESESGCLLGMQIGNFDNQTSGNHNPNLQLALFELEGGPSRCNPPFHNGDLKLKVVNINVPANIDPANPPAPSNWLKDADVTGMRLPAGYDTMQLLAINAGDLQGRSLRLGAPEKVVIPLQVQPDIVLGIPPMHIDYIAPNTNVLNPAKHPGCSNPSIPCALNLTVLPSLPAPGVGFSTGFSFSSDTSTSSQRKTTVSWGISEKITTEGSISYGDEIEGSNIDIKNTMSDSFNQTFAKEYNTYSGKTDSLSATTGFADHVFFTQKEMNVYYYPVLGRTGCPASNQNCPDSAKVPTYVAFSVPDQVTHADLDATTLEWYQPVHEPGNILSYPWNRNQLQSGFGDSLKVLTQDPPPCRGTDTSTTSYSTTWAGTQKQSNSMGLTNSFSDDLSVSYSSQAGIKDVLGASFSMSMDIGASSSLDSLNIDTSSVSASTGIAVNKPAFDSDVAQCCLYDFAGYLFGKQSPNETFQQITVNDQNGNPADLQQWGPLFVGFLADPVPDASGLSCGGTPTWWKQVYHVPDIGLNHPARWGWDKSTQTASFNPADRSGDLSPLDQPFYQMKGFFINKKGNQTQGPNLAQATAGDQLTLTSRVYNFSLADTNDPGLPDPVQAIRVRFYGQYYCSSGASTEKSCVDQNQRVCPIASLCGNAFPIGDAPPLSSIPGFKSTNNQGTLPNWTTANINFDTTKYPNAFLVFWVVTWMEDAQGNLVKEMPAHGLTALPSLTTIRQITDVPVEAYSNNAGMYGVNSPFFVAPPAAPGATEARSGAIDRVLLSGKQRVLLGEKDKVTAHFDVAGGSLGPLSVAYYDGKPGNGGKLIDVQHVQHISESSSYRHRIFFQPEACGDYTLYAEAFAPGLAPAIGKSQVIHVSIDAAAAVEALIASTSGTQIHDGQLRLQLLGLLDTALQAFRQFRKQPGDMALGTYREALKNASGTTISPDSAKRLIGQTGTILGCNAHATPPQLVVNRTFSRDAQNNVIANVMLTNTGGTTAGTTFVTVARIGATPATAVPTDPVNITAGSSASLKLVFPASAGASGRNTTLTVGGTYVGGGFNFTSRITLP